MIFCDKSDIEREKIGPELITQLKIIIFVSCFLCDDKDGLFFDRVKNGRCLISQKSYDFQSGKYKDKNDHFFIRR